MKNIFQKLALFLLPTLFLIIACSEKEVIPKSSAKAITKFRFTQFSPAIEGVIDETTKRVTAVAPPSADVTKLTPSISVSAKAKVLPDSGKIQDFTNEIAYTVTAEDGTVTTYKAMVSRTKFSGKDILEFSFADFTPAIVAKIDPATKTITATLPATADLTKLKPTLKLSDRATISPSIGVVTDFSKPVNFTVTAEDGITQVYVATISKEVSTIVFINNGKTVYAINSIDGSEIWKYSVSSSLCISPTVSNGKIYFGDSNASFYCLDAYTGKLQWNTDLEGGMAATCPIISNNTIYVSTYNSLYSLDIAKGKVNWQYSLSGDYFAFSPTLSNGTLYCCSTDKGYLYSVDAANGKLKWIFKARLAFQSNPAVYDGKVLIGEVGYRFYAIDEKNGQKIWEFKTGDSVYSSPTVSNGLVYFGDQDNVFRAIDINTGLETSKFTTGFIIFSSPYIYENVAFFASYDSKLYAIDINTFKVKWTYNIGEYNASSPVVLDNILYIGGYNQKLSAIDAITGRLKWEKAFDASFGYKSPVLLDKNGKVYHSGISGAQN